MQFNNKNLNLNYILIFSTLLLTGCKQKNLPKKLPFWSKQKELSNLDYNKKQETKINLYLLNSSDSKNFFGANICNKYQPLQLNISNKSQKSFILRSEYFEYDLVHTSEIMPLIKNNTSLFMFTTGYPALLYCWPLLPLLIIPKGYELHTENQYLEKFLDQNTLQPGDAIEILPYSSCNKLIFIKAKTTELNNIFKLQLYDKHENKLCNFELKLN